MTHQNQVDHTFWPHLQKNKQRMKTGWTTHSWNNAIWLALRPCHMTMTHKINKFEKPGGPQGNFHALFGKSPTFYGHFQADAVTSEWSIRISLSRQLYKLEFVCYFPNQPCECCIVFHHCKWGKSPRCWSASDVVRWQRLFSSWSFSSSSETMVTAWLVLIQPL